MVVAFEPYGLVRELSGRRAYIAIKVESRNNQASRSASKLADERDSAFPLEYMLKPAL